MAGLSRARLLMDTSINASAATVDCLRAVLKKRLIILQTTAAVTRIFILHCSDYLFDESIRWVEEDFKINSTSSISAEMSLNNRWSTAPYHNCRDGGMCACK